MARRDRDLHHTKRVRTRFCRRTPPRRAKVAKKKNNYLNKDNIGAFGSIFDISKIKIKDPLIVSSTDGVGTKLELANQFNIFNTIGIDLVAMCVNDLIVQGAKPLFFLDYIAVGKLKLNKMKKILDGIIKGCDLSLCSLVGGETAEMPGIYDKDKFDLAGFSVGIVSKKNVYFLPFKDLLLPRPELEFTVVNDKSNLLYITVTTKNFAKGVHVSCNSTNNFSDNFFDLPIHGTKTITLPLDYGTDIEALIESIEIRSLWSSMR